MTLSFGALCPSSWRVRAGKADSPHLLLLSRSEGLQRAWRVMSESLVTLLAQTSA